MYTKKFMHPILVFTQPLSFWRIVVMFFCSLLRLSSSQVAGIFTVASFAFAAAIATVSSDAAADQGSEACALLKWKTSLDNQSQASLSSWTTGTSPCKWAGIVCDNSNSVSTINVTNFGLKGNLHALNFSSFPNLLGLDISHNLLNGTIPYQICQLVDLKYLLFESNGLSGSIPSAVGMLANLVELDLSNNFLSGRIPSVRNLRNLKQLSLFNNSLSGPIPQELGKLSSLTTIKLSYNNLSGPIPPSIGNLANLSKLQLTNNSLSGSIPSSLGNLTKLIWLSCSQNRLSGSIPASIGNLVNLERLSLAENNLSGPIPSTFRNLTKLTFLLLQKNKLSGAIPPEMNYFTNLEILQCENEFTGQLPQHICLGGSLKSFANNENYFTDFVFCPKLRRNLLGQKKTKVTVLELFLDIGTGLLVVFVVGVSLCIICGSARKTDKQAREAQDPVSLFDYGDENKMNEIISEATEQFDYKYLISKGGVADVYKAKLPSGQVVAVKKFHSDLENFKSEVRALKEIKHRNIVKLFGFCSHPCFSFLVYEFLEGGSLDKILKDDTQAIAFDWNKRVKVVKGVANALFHMHHGCSLPIVHRDISSKNVLLDLEYEARISDFGTAKVLNPHSDNLSSFAGTYGYAAPELAYTVEANEKCDVYSFGVLSMEILMGMHPGDLISLMMSPSTASRAYELLLKDVLDQRLPRPTNLVVEEVVLIAEVALACLNVSPRSRPTMEQVSQGFVMPKSVLVAPFHRVTLL